MIRIGQFDSPFVRRVAVAMRIYWLAFRVQRWSVFGDAEKLGAINPPA
jgi:glutathione S-transferase